MLMSVKGHFNGTHIVTDENIRLKEGQEVIITVLNIPVPHAEKKLDLSKYMGRGDKMLQTDAQEYVKELRSNDRL